MFIFDYAIKAVVATLVVLGLGIVIIELSGVDMAAADEHEFFRYRLHAAAVIVAAYLLLDFLWQRRRAQMEIIAALMGQEERPRRSYGPFWFSLLLVAGGGAAFWHDHITHEIPNPVAVEGKFVNATCYGRGKNTGPYMSIGYEFPSLSSQVRTQEMKCFVDKCESDKAPQQVMDTEYKQVFYSSQQECTAALPAVLAAKPPATVWTGDKGPQAAVRARFTPERHPPPYFLLWLPLSMAAAVLVFSAVRRVRRPGEE